MAKWPAVLLSIVAIARAGTAHAAPCDALDDLQWLLGSWLAEGSKSSFQESWTRAGSHTFEGTGVERAMADGAVKGAEELRLTLMAGEVFYISKVAHNALPVAFRLTACDDGRFVFENAGHDFPKRLEYRREADGRLKVEVSDGAGKGLTLDFARAAGAATAGPAAAVIAAEDARFAAMVAAEPAALRRWFAADLHYAHSDGRVEDRDQLVESIASGGTRYLAVTPSERTVTMLGADAAVVRARARVRAERGGATHDFQARYLAVYRLQEGDWKLQAWQSINLP